MDNTLEKMSRKNRVLFTLAQVKELEKKGHKVNWPPDMLDQKGRPKKVEKKNPYKDMLKREIILILEKYPLLDLKKELLFRKPDKHRFDFAIMDVAAKGNPKNARVKIAVEYEGIHSKKSRHTTQDGFCGDVDKYGLAAALGWTVLRYTAHTIENVKTELPACLSR